MKKWLILSVLSSQIPLAASLLTRDAAPEPQQECTPCNRTGFYFGGFGGWGSNSFDIAQKGIAFYYKTIPDSGGPLVVDSVGESNTNDFTFGGVHFGYEWLKNTCSWSVTPAVELEGFYFSQTKKVTLENPTDRLDFHEFKDKFPMRVGVVLANFVVALDNNYISPYAGVGVGAGIFSIHDAKAIQTEFPEPGINHFNTNPDAFNWNFAAQAKAGLRFGFCHMRFFAEYRYLFFSATHYTFGHTVYPGHVATADWDIRFDGINNNLFAFGIDFPL